MLQDMVLIDEHSRIFEWKAVTVTLTGIDWWILGGFFAFTLLTGLWVSRRAGRSQTDFFLSGRDKSWWLLGTSMVATTFAADTPLLVTGIVRESGVAGNWLWWAFLITGMLTVSVYAKLWRRSGIITDNEFYEMRYSGKTAAALRGFRAAYLGLIFNVIVMANVTLAAIKIGQIMFGFSPMQTILVAAVVTVVFSTLGGLTSVLITDFVLFIIAMIGSIGAAVVLLGEPEVGGLAGLLSNPNVQAKTAMFPALDFGTTEGLNLAMSILIIPLAVQWWAAWYPGAEPGGGGYAAQRMLAAKNESHATGATLLFNAAHYALRPWPWIIIGLISIAVYPDVASLKEQFPEMPEQMVKDDLAYPAMLQRLPAGLLGLVTTSLIAAYMSTISTHLNWGSSYIVNDIWKRFVRPSAGERELVRVGRATTVVLMVLAAVLALRLTSVLEGFQLLLKVGAGTGLIYILRWFWWRINALAEIVAMVVSFFLAAALFFYGSAIPDWLQFVIIVGVTTICWMLAVLLGPVESMDKLQRFCATIQPGGPGWSKVIRAAHAEGKLTELDESWSMPSQILFMISGCIAIYGILFATGFFLYGEYDKGAIALGLVTFAAIILKWKWSAVAGRPD
jgi:SSS family solute:Na+ symporter